MWPDNPLAQMLGIELPIIQAPMAGANGADMVIAVCKAGGLGSLPCAMLDVPAIRSEVEKIRSNTGRPFNMNFFCHTPVSPEQGHDDNWKQLLSSYYTELGLDPKASAPSVNRSPFDNDLCELVEDIKPSIVSFHFGLPDQALVRRVKEAGCLVLSSATTVKEAQWLEAQGCDAIIAQGVEAGGHRGVFLDEDLNSQCGTIALVPQIVDAVSVPVIAAGGIADARGIAAAMMLGASAVQVGTAYLLTRESLITDLHRQALLGAGDCNTALTNIFSGRPARGLVNRIMRDIGPMTTQAPPFPTAGGALAPLKAKAESQGLSDFSSLWSGQAASLARETDAESLTQTLARQTTQLLG